MTIRSNIAAFVGRTIFRLMRLLGREASYTPANIALKLCPELLGMLPRPETVILVTGTDGKTTTANLITTLLEKQGRTVACNRLGSNTIVGITNTIMTNGNAEIAVLETDEHWLRIVAPQLKPDYVIVTGLLRDSLQRNAHPEYVFYKMSLTECKDMTVILNADELCSARLFPENRRLYYSIGRLDTDHPVPPNRVNDFPICPECGGELIYDYARYGNVGHASCPECGFSSPEADFLISNVNPETRKLIAEYRGETHEIPMINDGIFNIYNEAAALLLLLDMGTDAEEAGRLAASAEITKTRYSSTEVNGVEIIHTMAKGNNSLPVSMVFDYIRSKPGTKAVVMALDDADEKASSERIGWIYDTDYEFLKDDNIKQIIAVGTRCRDQYLRLLLAGIDRDRLVCGTDEIHTLEKLRTDVDAIYLLHDMSTYDESVRAENRIVQILEERACL